jgi:hypothetical protein
MPTWRADYFDKARDRAPTRSVIIKAEYETDALDEARAKMGSACSGNQPPHVVSPSWHKSKCSTLSFFYRDADLCQAASVSAPPSLTPAQALRF